MSVRVYVPLTSSGLAGVVAQRRLAGPFRAHAVTDALREEWPDGDDDDWEYAALGAAAATSSRLRATADRPRRYVLAGDVPAATAVPGDDPTLVEVAADLPWKNVASAHVDVTDVESRTGAEEDDLAWFATQEIPGLL